MLRRTLDFLGLSTSSSDDDLRAALKPLRLIHGSNATFGATNDRNAHASVPPDSRLQDTHSRAFGSRCCPRRGGCCPTIQTLLS